MMHDANSGRQKTKPAKCKIAYVPAYQMPQETSHEARILRQQVRLDDTRVHAIGRYALAAKPVVQGSGVDDVGEFGVAVAFPESGVNS